MFSMTMRESDWVYIACLIETEGCIYDHRSSKGPWISIKLTIHQKDPRVLYWVEEITGLGRVRSRTCRGNVSYDWILTKKREVRIVLEQCLPHMKIKPEQAKCALKFIETGDTKWTLLLRKLKHHYFH